MTDRNTPSTNISDSGSPARVAFELMKYLRETVDPEIDKASIRKSFLDLYAECLDAANGHRRWDAD